MKKRTYKKKKKKTLRVAKKRKATSQTPSSLESFGYTVIAKPSKPSFSKSMIEKMMAKSEDE